MKLQAALLGMQEHPHQSSWLILENPARNGNQFAFDHPKAI